MGHAQREAGRAARGTLKVLIVADPGLPHERAQRERRWIEENLSNGLGGDVSVDVTTFAIRVTEDNTVSLNSLSGLDEQYPDTDVYVVLTEMPRHVGGRPVIAQIFDESGVAVLSCPTLGVTRPRKRLRRVVFDVVVRMVAGEWGSSVPRSKRAIGGWGPDGHGGEMLCDHVLTGGVRTVLGMTASNEPWKALRRLSGVISAAIATGAFGVFYNSVWQMSDALSLGRLLCIGLLAMVMMGTWLIVSNHLWDQPRQETLVRTVLLYNLSTVLTLALTIFGLYVILVVGIFLAGLVVIDPSFMSELLGKPADLSNYLDIAWMSAALGLVAGALGSGFDSETDVRRLTHAQRERARREVSEEEDADGNEDMMLCLYDKVQRVKNKWKCVLRDGVASIGGRDYLFSKCNGCVGAVRPADPQRVRVVARASTWWYGLGRRGRCPPGSLRTMTAQDARTGWVRQVVTYDHGVCDNPELIL